MRITQHEENRGEGIEGRGEGRGEGGKGGTKVRDGVEEKEIKEEKREQDSGHCQISISHPFQVNPGIVFGVCEKRGAGNEYGSGSPDSLTRLAHNLHLLNVRLVSWVCIPSTD